MKQPESHQKQHDSGQTPSSGSTSTSQGNPKGNSSWGGTPPRRSTVSTPEASSETGSAGKAEAERQKEDVRRKQEAQERYKEMMNPFYIKGLQIQPDSKKEYDFLTIYKSRFGEFPRRGRTRLYQMFLDGHNEGWHEGYKEARHVYQTNLGFLSRLFWKLGL